MACDELGKIVLLCLQRVQLLLTACADTHVGCGSPFGKAIWLKRIYLLNNLDSSDNAPIAKDYGMSGQALNKLLHELGIQYKMRDTWLLYQEYANRGYTQSRTHNIDAGRSVMHTYWTQKGRLFLYDLLKSECGRLPVIERGAQ